MGKGLSLGIYTQANAGTLRNSDGAFYSNFGAGAGFDTTANFDGKNSLIFGANANAGTAVSTNAYVGYKRSLGNNSSLVFTGNVSYDKSLTKTDSYNIHIDNRANVNNKEYQLDLVDKKYDWKPDNLQISGRIGFNKKTKWGGYEVGAEVGNRTNSSPDFNTTSGSKSTFDMGDSAKQNIETHYEYGRERQEGMFASPYGKAWVNLTNDEKHKIIGNIDSHQLGVSYRFTF